MCHYTQYPPYFLRQGIWMRNTMIQIDWKATKLQGSSCLYNSSARVTDMHCILAFMWQWRGKEGGIGEGGKKEKSFYKFKLFNFTF